MKILFLIPFMLLIPLSSFAYNYPPVPISNAVLNQVWHDRSDLQIAYPEVSANNYTRIYNWAITEPSGQADRTNSELQASNEIKITNSPVNTLPTPKMIAVNGEWTWDNISNWKYYCESFGPFYNTTVSNADFTESSTIFNMKNTNGSFSESLIRVIISPFYLSNGPSGFCYDQTNHEMNWINWRDYYLNQQMSFIFPSIISKLQYPTMSETITSNWTINQKIPDGYYINVIVDGASLSANNDFNNELQMKVYTK